MSSWKSWLRFFLAASLLSGATILIHARRRAEEIVARKELALLPKKIGPWNGQEIGIPLEVLAALGPGDFLSRIYRHSAEETPVELFVAYFQSQRAGDTIHSPKNCLPGSGWAPVDSGRIGLRTNDGTTFEVNRYIIAKGPERMLVLYWYQAHGRIVASEYWAKAYLVHDAIRANRTDGALIRIITPLRPAEPRAGAEQRAVAFAQQLLPTLDRFVPR